MGNTTQVKDYTQGHLREQMQLKHKAGKSTNEIMEDLGIWSSRTVCKRKEAESIESKSSAPKNPKRVYTMNQLYTLYTVRKQLKLRWDDCLEYIEENYDFKIWRTTWFGYLKEWWLTKKEKRKVWVFKEYDPGYIHIDVSYWPKIGGKKAYIYVAIDRATRIIYIEVHENKKASTAASFLRNTIEFFPFEIEKILTDNGKEFTSRNHLWKYDLQGLFDKVCEEFEIEHRRTKAYCPQTNGMVEKTNDLIKIDTLKKFDYLSCEDIEVDMWQFMLYFNLYRRHWWLKKEGKWRTPYDALVYYRSSEIEVSRKESPEEWRERLLKLAKEKWRKEYPKWK